MQAAGALAVIVYDNVYEGFLHMKNDGSIPQPTIPSIFITKSEGLYLIDLLTKVVSGSLENYCNDYLDSSKQCQFNLRLLP